MYKKGCNILYYIYIKTPTAYLLVMTDSSVLYTFSLVFGFSLMTTQRGLKHVGTNNM